MNTANKLTLFRVVLVPVFMALLMIDNTACKWAALGVFVLASLTDMLDGYIARSRNQITTFGKFAAPLADKILTTAAVLVFLGNGTYNAVGGTIALMIIMTREFMVAGVRLVAVGEGEVIAANIWGKLKTVAQMIAIIITIILTAAVPNSGKANIIIEILLWVTVAFTVISGIDYLCRNLKFMK
ncbi:MAG: CDP-diacylglycerol--glycerol-3-phosphate 3-phosphatidyltransferase, partial [Firmicutes bacterium]|nr:CDP-diacylglycerol--glycerol-3-phosphate 3-phosphatidyltransferase [Bacillota bacterium]